MHGTIAKPATTAEDCIDAAGRFVLSAVMTLAHQRRRAAAGSRFPITFAMALREAWSRAKAARGMRRDIAELVARAARGDIATSTNTAAFSDDPRISAEYARSLAA